MAYELYGEALALGEDTLTEVETSSTIDSRGPIDVAKGYVQATALAEDDEEDEPFAEALTDVAVYDADLTIIWSKDQSVDADGLSADVSLTKFFALDFPHWESNITIVIGEDEEIEIHGGWLPIGQRWGEKRSGDLPDLDGNVATLDVEADALGEDTFVSVDAFTLAIEDELSESAVFVTGAVG